MSGRKNLKHWNIPVTQRLNDIVDKAVSLDSHVSKSELIRTAVREKLAKMGLKEELETLKREGNMDH